MKMVRDALNFFRQDPKWGVLLASLTVIFVFLYFRAEEAGWKGRPHQALQKFQRAEDRLKTEISKSGGVVKFLEKRPALRWALNLISLLLIGVILGGFVLDFFWFTRPGFRSRIQVSTGPPEARSWGLAAVLKTILLFIVGSMGLSILLALVKSVVFRGTDANPLILIHTTLSDLLCVGLVLHFVRQSPGRWRDLGFKCVRFWKDIWIGIAGYVAVLPIFILTLLALLALIQFLSFEPPPHPLVEVFLEEEHSPLVIAYSIFLACVVGPVFEEIFFRGFFYPALKKRWGVAWGLVLSSVFFSAIHQNLFAFLPVFVLGLCLGYLYEKRGSLLSAIALHIVHNSVFILYFFLAKEVLTRGS